MIPNCPFCGGKVLHTKADKATRTPDMVTCVGYCFFTIESDYVENESLKWYLKAFEKEKK